MSPIIPKTLGENAEGFKAIQAFSDFNESNKTMEEIKEFQKEHKIEKEDQYYVKGWVTGKIIEEAVKRVLEKNNNQVPETEKFRSMLRDELEGISNFDVGSAVKPIHYSDHKGVTQAKIVQIKNGKYEPITDWIELK